MAPTSNRIRAALSSRRVGSLVAAAAIGIRLLAASALLFGPWTDDAAELSGWDAERFVAIAESDAKPWAEVEVEYPPGSVVAIEVLHRAGARLGGGSVGLNRALAIAGLLADGAAAWVLWKRFGSHSALVYLALGTALVPMGLLRLDLLTVALATLAAAQLGPGRSKRSALLFGVAVGLGASIKLWPVLLVLPALALRRWVSAAAALGVGGALLAVWLAWTGAGIEPIGQVLSLRDATGWHVESLPGAVVALATDEQARFELNAFRIGELRPGLVAAGRLIAAIAFVAMTAVAWRQARDRRSVETIATLTLGSVGILLATSALLSPQFMLWLTPWVALCLTEGGERRAEQAGGLGAAAIVLTGAVLALATPAGVDGTLAAAALCARNALILASASMCALSLGRQPALQP